MDVDLLVRKLPLLRRWCRRRTTFWCVRSLVCDLQWVLAGYSAEGPVSGVDRIHVEKTFGDENEPVVQHEGRFVVLLLLLLLCFCVFG